MKAALGKMINLKRCFEPQKGPVWPPHPCQRIVLVGEVEDAVGVTTTVCKEALSFELSDNTVNTK